MNLKKWRLVSIVFVLLALVTCERAFAAPIVGGISFNDDLPRAELKPMEAKLDASPKQDCICFNNKAVELKEVNGSWKIVDNNHWILDFTQNKSQGQKSLEIIQSYKLNNICFVGRPFPSQGVGGRMMYFLSDGTAPAGPILKDEDTVAFENAKVKAEKIQGNWKVTCGQQWMLDFGTDEGAAQNAADIIKYHEFQRQAFIGRPGASMMYFLK